MVAVIGIATAPACNVLFAAGGLVSSRLGNFYMVGIVAFDLTVPGENTAAIY
jgi:hypothetical protein